MNEISHPEQQDESLDLAVPAELAQRALDALSVHIAIVDKEGIIVAVNRAWKLFGAANGISDGAGGVGANYLAVCETGNDPASDGAASFSAGLKAVLGADRDLFEMEYPCDTVDGQMWFNARVTVFPGNNSRYVAVTHEDITARRQAEDALKRRTEELEEVTRSMDNSRRAALNMMEDAISAKQKLELTQFSLDHAGDPAFWVDPSARIVYANEAACRSLGYSREELLKLSAPDIDPNYSMERWPAYWKAGKKNRFSKFESQHRTRDGRIFPVEIHISVVEYGDQEFQCIFAHNITVRKQQHLALQQSEEMMRSSQSVAHICSYSTRLNGNEIEESRWICSPEFYKIFGIDETYPHTIAGWAAFIHPEFRDEMVAYHESVIKEKCAFNKEYKIIRIDDGAERWVHGTGELEFDEKGIPVRMHGAIQDITDRKQAETEVRAARKQLQYIIDHTHDVIFQMDLAGNFTYVNFSAKQMTGYAPEQLLNTNMLGLVATEYHEQVIGRLQKRIAGDLAEGSFSFEIIRKDGRRIWAELVTAPTLNESGELVGVQGVARDITERKQLQEAIEKQILALTQPVDDSEDIDFDVLFSLEEIQRIQDEFAAATGVASLILRPDGTPITRPSNFTRLCGEIVRKNDNGIDNCRKSDALIGKYHPQGPVIRPCVSCGLWDAGVNLTVCGKHIASWLIGQVRNEIQSDDQMRAYAREIGVDEEEFIAAYHEVPEMSRDHFEEIAQSLFTLANQLSSSAYQNIQQARFISEQKKSAAALQESREYLEAMWSAMDVGIMLIDAETREILRINPALLNISGHSENDLVGKRCHSLVCPAEENKCPVDDLGQAVDRSERILIHRDGREIQVEKSVIPIMMDGRRVYIETLLDITERKQAEAELRRLSTAIEQSPETIVITDTEGVIQYTNPAFESVTGYRLEEAIGQKPSVLKSGAHDDAFYANIWDTIISGRTWTGRIINAHKNGTHYTEEATISPVTDSAGEIINYVAVKRDISAELVHEEELRQAQKMDAIGQLASGVAHDFNNILQGIQGFSELLQMTLETDSLEHRNATEIHKAAKRAAELTRQLLTFSRKQPRRPVKIELHQAVHDAEALLHMLLGEMYELVLLIDEKPLPILADQGQLAQVIMNLAVNARDAMPEGGRLTISTKHVIFGKDDVTHLPNARQGVFACLEVTDNGCGMTAKMIEKIFNPFFTTKEIGKGTGLGLSVIYGIVNDSDGWINVYSEIDLGTTMRIYFPLIDQKQTAGEIRRPDSRSPSDINILFIEDDPEVAKVAIRILSEAGYHLLAATNAEDGLALFKEENGRFDLLMSDMMLPGMDGSQLADAIREINPELPVILFSGYTDQKERWQHLNNTNYLFENKPFTAGRLVHMVENVFKINKESN